MGLKIGKILSVTVVLMMVLDIIGAAATAYPIHLDDQAAFSSKKNESSVISSLFIEKAEEENEKSEEEKRGCSRVVIADFSRIAFSLSRFHTPHVCDSARAHHYDVRPPLHAFNCTFII
jgi:hypothetical protein